MKLLLFIGLLVSTAVSLVEGLPSGASAAACDTLAPASAHGLIEQSTPVPYQVDLSAFSNGAGGYEYQPGQTYALSVSGINNEMFRGFFVQARPFNADSTRVGQFVVTDGGANSRLSSCTISTDGITHTNRNDKMSVYFNWTAPTDSNTGPVRFGFAVVQTLNVYWADERSPTVQQVEEPTLPPATMAPTTMAPTTASAAITFEQDTYSGEENGDLKVFVVSDMPVSETTLVVVSVTYPQFGGFIQQLTITLETGETQGCGTLNFPNDNVDSGLMMLELRASINGMLVDTATLNFEDDDTPPMCEGLTAPLNGGISFSDDFAVGSIATYTCDDPYLLNGTASRVCENVAGGAEWSGSAPTCDFPTFNNATISFEQSAYTVMEGSSIEVCIVIDRGFIGIGFSFYIWIYAERFHFHLHYEVISRVVVGYRLCDNLAIEDDDMFGDNVVVTVPLNISQDISGVTLGQDSFELTIIDNDGPLINECAMGLDDCDDNANCTDIDRGFICTCLPGFTGDGRSCIDIDECTLELDNCDMNADCNNTVGSFECACQSGYMGNGFSCVNINECDDEELNNCDGNATCFDTDGSFTCTCLPGFTGDGTSCIDIDECLSSPCAPQFSSCNNVPGSFECICNPGFSGNGFFCEDIDECMTDMDDCDDNAECNNTIGSFTCTCNPGYEGDGVTCNNIDECTLMTDNCDMYATCNDTDGSFECMCNPGFEGDGFDCEDIDECALNMDNCDVNANCTNTPGSFVCTCLDGFFGNGIICMQDVVRLSLVRDRYSVIEGGSILVYISVYNPIDREVVIYFSLYIQALNYSRKVMLSVPANSMFHQGEMISIPDDNYLNKMDQRVLQLLLKSSDPLVIIVEDAESADIVVVDNDVIKIGFEMTEYTFREDERARLCVQLVQGSSLQRPVAVRLNTRECPDAAYPATAGEDFAPLCDIVSIDIGSMVGNLSCFYIDLIDDMVQEGVNETFKVVMDVQDIGAYPLLSRRVATVEIIDVLVMCPELEIGNGTVIITGDRTPGSMASYSCDEFYMLDGNEERTCQDNGTWTGEDPECERGAFSVICQETLTDPITGPLMINCSIDGPAPIVSTMCNFDSGDRVEACMVPLTVNFEEFDAGPHTLVITFTDADDIAVIEMFTFDVPVTCPPLSLDNGDLTITGTLFDGGYLAGAMVNYSCDPFFTLAGNEERTCQENGTWTGEDPECERDDIILMCSSSQISPSSLPDVSCTAEGPFPIIDVTCVLDGTLSIADCNISDPLADITADQLGPGDHELVITVTDSDGANQSETISFFLPEELDLVCMQVSLTALEFSFMCSANNNLSEPLSCEILGEGGQSITVENCTLGEVITVGIPPLDSNITYTLTVSATDVFEQTDSASLMFTLPEPDPLILQFNDDTPQVDGSTVRVSFVANQPLSSANCGISSGTSGSCDLAADGLSGSFTHMNVINPGRGSDLMVTITATSTAGSTASLQRLFRSETGNRCSVHLINEIEMNSDNATLEYMLTGPDPPATGLDSAACGIFRDSVFIERIESCPNPLVLTPPGVYRVIILPIDRTPGVCGRINARAFSFTL